CGNPEKSPFQRMRECSATLTIPTTRMGDALPVATTPAAERGALSLLKRWATIWYEAGRATTPVSNTPALGSISACQTANDGTLWPVSFPVADQLRSP